MFLAQRFWPLDDDGMLLLRTPKTFEPTRSGSGDAEALGERFPRIRTLFERLHPGSQAQFCTFPFPVGDGGDGFSWVKIGKQRIVELPACFQVRTKSFGLRWSDDQR